MPAGDVLVPVELIWPATCMTLDGRDETSDEVLEHPLAPTTHACRGGSITVRKRRVHGRRPPTGIVLEWTPACGPGRRTGPPDSLQACPGSPWEGGLWADLDKPVSCFLRQLLLEQACLDQARASLLAQPVAVAADGQDVAVVQERSRMAVATT
jgi:hypothetical protein